MPKTVALAVDALQSHKWDEAHDKAKKNGAQQQRNNNDGNDRNSNDNGDEDQNEEQQAASLAQHNNAGQGFCCCSGSKDHMSPECLKKGNMEKKDWVINTGG